MKLPRSSSPFLITHLAVRPWRAALNQTFRIATGEHQELENIFIHLHLVDGSEGFGEAAVATHITGETVQETFKNLQKATEWLEGKNALDYLKIFHELRMRFSKNPCMLAALEMAILDALTRSFQRPLWSLWGAQPTSLHSDITLVITSVEETAQKAQQFYNEGFRSFKIKIGQDADLDLSRIQAVHKIAPHAQLLLDGNQGYTAQEAITLINALKRFGITPELFEQPVPKEDWEGLEKVGRETGVCICADESASSLETALSLMKKKIVRALNVKIMKTGIMEALEISRWAKAYGMKLMIGGMLESNLAMTASAHIAAGIGFFDFIDLDTPFFISGEKARNPFLSNDGVYDLKSAKAGIGIVPATKENK